MSDIEDAVKGLLSSPEGMSNIMSLIGSLKGASSNESSESSVSMQEAGAQQSPIDLSAFKGIDPKIISSAMKILGDYSADDDRIKLLLALKPHLNQERSERIDKATKIMRITKSIHSAMDVFGGGGQNV